MALRQNEEGNWTLTVGHSTPGVVISGAYLTFTHDGIEESMEPFDITSQEKTLETGWYTELGTTIDVESEIEKYPPENHRFTQNGKKYVVHWDLQAHAHSDSGLTPELSIRATTSTSIPASGGSVSISVSSNTAWTLSTSESWATLNVNSGNGNNNSIKVTLGRYTDTTKDRTVKVIAHGGGLTREITITQRKADVTPTAGIYVTAAQTRIDASGGSVTLAVSSNTAWTLSSNQTWAVLRTTAGSGNNNSVVLDIQSYSGTDSDRNVRITANAGSASDNVTIYQNKYNPGPGPGPDPVISYGFVISADPTTIEWSGSSWLTGEFITYEDDLEVGRTTVLPSAVVWTITKNSAYTEPVTSEGELVAKNDTIYNNREVKVKGTYNGYESNEVSIQVNKKPSTQTRYEVLITPLSNTAITSAGSVTMKAEFLTYADGATEPTSRLDVTSACTWESNKEAVASVSNGVVTGHNETYEEQLVTIKATYDAGGEIGSYYDTQTITVAEKEGEAPATYYTLVVVPTAATIEYSGSTQLQAILYTYQEGNPNPVASATVTSNATWTTDNQYIGVSDDRLSKGKVQGYNYTSDVMTANITATYQQAYSALSASSVITCTGREIDIDVDTDEVKVECSGEYTFTRQITADADLTWHVAVVDVNNIGQEVDWVSASPVNGTGSGEVTITILSDNTAKLSRHCFVWIYYPSDSNTKKEIGIVQYPTPNFVLQPQTINAPQLGSIENINVVTNYPLTLDNNGNDWITLSQAETSNGYKAIVTTSESSAQRSGVVYIGSEYSGECATFNPVPITVNQEYTPPVPPSGNDKVYLYETETSSRVDTLSYNKSAAAQDIEFYISTNANCIVSSVTCTSVCGSTAPLTITETNGTDLTNGATIVPTGLDNKRKLIIHLPQNQYIGYNRDRTYEIRIVTTSYSSSDLNYSDHVEITVHQAYNDYYDTDYTMLFLMGAMDIGQDEITFNSSARYEKPMVVVNARRVYTAGYSSETQVTDYIDNSGVVDGKMSLTVVGDGVVVTRDHTHEGPYIATLNNPYEIYMPANETFDQTGNTKNMTFTLSYTGIGGNVSKTITVHQEWAQKQLEPVDAHMLSGSNSVHVDTASYTAATSGANATIHLQPNTYDVYVTCETGVTLMIGGEYSNFTVGGDMQYGVPYDLGSSNGKSINLVNTRQQSGHYTITITCSKSGKAQKNLLIDVYVQ